MCAKQIIYSILCRMCAWIWMCSGNVSTRVIREPYVFDSVWIVSSCLATTITESSGRQSNCATKNAMQTMRRRSHAMNGVCTNYVCHFWYMFVRSFLISCQIKINFTWNNSVRHALVMYDNSCTHSVRSLQIVYFINSQTKFIRAQIARPYVDGELHYSAAIFRRSRWLPCTCRIEDSKTLHDLCCIIRSESTSAYVCARIRFKYVIFLSFTTIYFSHFDILLPHRRLCFIISDAIFFFRSIFVPCSALNLWLVELCKFNRFRFNI